MPWGRLDDHAWQNEKLIGLSNAAHRLYWVAISFAASEWPHGAGRLSPARARSLARLHGVCSADDEAIDGVVDELVEKRCWIRLPRMFAIHDIKRYMPPADLSAKRASAGRKGRNARSTNESALAIAEQLPSKRQALAEQTSSSGIPYPVPGLTPLSPNGDIVPLHPVVDGSSTATSKGNGSKHRPPDDEVARTVFAAWVGSTGRSDCKLTEGRRAKIRARSREGYPLADLVDAVRGWKHDPWPERPRNNDITQLLRDGSQVEKFRDLERGVGRAVLPAGSAWEA